MKIFAILLAALTLTACAKQAEQTEHTGAKETFEVDTLFTKDSCTVYRFYDAGEYRYFTNCSGGTNWQRCTGSGRNRHCEESGVEGGKP